MRCARAREGASCAKRVRRWESEAYGSGATLCEGHREGEGERE